MKMKSVDCGKNAKSSVLDVLNEDIAMWKKIRKENLWISFFTRPEFRYLIYYRLRMSSVFFRVLLFPLKLINTHNLYINCRNIGGGLFLEHAFSVIISCEKIGMNCYINQQVTIGYSTKGQPIIGNDVEIKAGAKVIGDIVVGDDVIIGANAVVNKNVPSHSVVVGCPARIVKQRKNLNDSWKRCDIKL